MKEVTNLKGSVILKRTELDEMLRKEFERGVKSVTETKPVIETEVKIKGKSAKLKNAVKKDENE